MATAYRIKGTVTDVTTCNCCGRTGLRRTVALTPLDADSNEAGEVGYYGTGCAATLLSWTNNRVTRAAKAADMHAEIQRDHQRSRARRILATYGPVENASVREKFQVYRDSNLRPDGPFTTVSKEIAQMLTEARAVLSA